MTFFGNQLDTPTSGYINNQTAITIKAIFGSSATTILKSSYNYSNRTLVTLASPAHNYKIN